jgi:glycosyltransferase involved in cell wall biosynthesis
MRVAVVDGDAAYPPSSGKRLRTLNLMLRLAHRHRLTYIARCNDGPEALRRAEEYLRDNGVEPVLVDHPLPRKNGPAFYARLAANLLSPLPYSVASFDSPALRRAVQEHEERRPPDLWQFEWTPFLGLLRRPENARRVLIVHNVDALIWRRYHATERRPLRRWYVRGQWKKFERFERRMFAEADRVVTVSDEDAALARRLYGVENVEVVDNGVDAAFYAAAGEPGRVSARSPSQVLFLGSLDWRPNLDAVQLLLDDIFPAVRALLGRGQETTPQQEARLCIVGRRPPEWLRRRVAATDFAELHADVADVRPFLAESGVMAVPLRIGGGSRLKILEALAAGLPVVSTRVGAEGLRLEDGRELTVVERPEDMAAALADCIRAPEKPRRMADAGRRVVRERYDWDVLAGRLEAVWEGMVGGRRRVLSTQY